MTRPRRLLIVVNVGWFFVSHRLPVAVAARKAGYEVHVACALDPELDADTERLLGSLGLHLHILRFSRSGSAPWDLVRDMADLTRLFKALRPDLVHLVTLKPMLLGGIVAKVAGLRGVILAVPGRGSVFTTSGLRASLRRRLVMQLYRLAYRREANRVIIQNSEDRDFFLANRMFAESDIRFIRGSGADLSRLTAEPEPAGAPVVVFVSRMLRQKGVEDFVAAATALRARLVPGRFVLVGDPDPGNRQSHTREELQQWARSGVVEWWGHRADINAVFASSHIMCLPTYYGEGVPKVLIEAAACGRPIVTTDAPGCNDIVHDGDNGLLVPPRDVPALTAALERLMLDAELRIRMGQRGRQRAVEEFSLDRVIDQTLAIYQELGS